MENTDRARSVEDNQKFFNSRDGLQKRLSSRQFMKSRSANKRFSHGNNFFCHANHIFEEETKWIA